MDDDETFSQMQRFLERFVADPKPQLEHYQGPMPIFDHFGIEVHSSRDVWRQKDRFQALGLKTLTEEATTCCYALQDKVWIQGIDGLGDAGSGSLGVVEVDTERSTRIGPHAVGLTLRLAIKRPDGKPWPKSFSRELLVTWMTADGETVMIGVQP